MSAGCPRILGEVLNLRGKLGDHFLLPIARHHPDYSHRFRAPQIAETDVETRPPFPTLPAMPLTLDQIVAETRQWPEDTVAELLDRITLAKHGGLAPEREAAWAAVASRRSAEIASGKEKLVPGHEVSAQIRRIVGR